MNNLSIANCNAYEKNRHGIENKAKSRQSRILGGRRKKKNACEAQLFGHCPLSIGFLCMVFIQISIGLLYSELCRRSARCCCCNLLETKQVLSHPILALWHIFNRYDYVWHCFPTPSTAVIVQSFNRFLIRSAYKEASSSQ